MTEATRIQPVVAFIGDRPMNRLQVEIALLCFLIVAIDGLDTAMIGFLAPAIRAEWGLTPPQLAPIFGAGLFGLMAGALAFGPLADRWGRKSVLLLTILVFGVASLVSAQAQTPAQLIGLRFLTGLGIGGAMPTALTLTSEYSPEARRQFLVTAMFCGFTAGSALGGFISAALVEAFGWRSALLFGGALPLACLPLLLWRLPESLRFLVMRNAPAQTYAHLVKRLAPEVDPEKLRFVATQTKPDYSAVAHLFKREYLSATLFLWLAFFMSLLVIYLLSSWLPTMLKTSGETLKASSLVTAMFQVGGASGALALGWLMDRFSSHRVLAIAYAASALFIAATGLVAAAPLLAALAVFSAGFCLSGAQVGAGALAASLYPTDCRATGVAWALGVGRLGSILGAMSGGALLASGRPFSQMFVLIGLPPLVSALAMALLSRTPAATGQ